MQLLRAGNLERLVAGISKSSGSEFPSEEGEEIVFMLIGQWGKEIPEKMRHKP